tara:strand:- start:2038 stop:2628 length:591 start_codon:yes stop_codon:yes gene_type:complete
MPDSEAVKRLLSGDIDPKEIEDDPSLYAMAERIYGVLALEELGITAPQIRGVEISHSPGAIPSDITLPDFIPEVTETKNEVISKGGKFGALITWVGIAGFFGVIFNMIIGAGVVLCSTGIANMKQICNDDYGQTKLVISNGYTPERMHEIESWVKPMTEPLGIDIVFLIFFFATIVIGILIRKRSIHSSNMIPLAS